MVAAVPAGSARTVRSAFEGSCLRGLPPEGLRLRRLRRRMRALSAGLTCNARGTTAPACPIAGSAYGDDGCGGQCGDAAPARPATRAKAVRHELAPMHRPRMRRRRLWRQPRRMPRLRHLCTDAGAASASRNVSAAGAAMMVVVEVAAAARMASAAPTTARAPAMPATVASAAATAAVPTTATAVPQTAPPAAPPASHLHSDRQLPANRLRHESTTAAAVAWRVQPALHARDTDKRRSALPGRGMSLRRRRCRVQRRLPQMPWRPRLPRQRLPPGLR
jgi:hypothetical protein